MKIETQNLVKLVVGLLALVVIGVVCAAFATALLLIDRLAGELGSLITVGLVLVTLSTLFYFSKDWLEG